MSQITNFFLGYSVPVHKPRPAIKNQIYGLLRIWRNYSHFDYGIERIIRLTLATAQFFTPGLYIKHFAGMAGTRTAKLCTELYVLLKLSFPIVCLKTGWYLDSWALYLAAFLMAETLLYLASLIYLSDVMQNAIQPHRSLTLLFFNFFEIVGTFGLFYAHFDARIENFFNVHISSPINAVYFSFVTAATIGYGDISPEATLCKELVMAQITLTFVFVGLFLNFFSSLLFKFTSIQTGNLYRKKSHHMRRKRR